MFWLCLLVAAAPAIDVGNHKQLFIDHKFIAESDRVELRTNQAQKLGRILDQNGQLLQGHVSNFIDQRVYWKSSADVSALAGKPVRIRLNMKRAKLYAFQFTQQ